jgi:hypothetical protein
MSVLLTDTILMVAFAITAYWCGMRFSGSRDLDLDQFFPFPHLPRRKRALIGVVIFLAFSATGLFMLKFISLSTNPLLLKLAFMAGFCIVCFNTFRNGFEKRAFFGRLPKGVQAVVIALPTTIIGTGWAWSTSWIAYDLLCFIVVYHLTSRFQPPRLVYILTILVLWAIYDAIMVFGTDLMVHAFNQMGFIMPGSLIIPKELTVHSLPSHGMGLGDLIAGMLVVLAAWRYGLKLYIYVAFGLAILITMYFVITFRIAMPALVVLSPMLLLGLIVGAKIKGVELNWKD